MKNTIWLVILGLVVAGFASLAAFDVARVSYVMTGSMEPAINVGDLVVTINDEYRSPVVGDVVMYQGKSFDGEPIANFTHRIVDTAADGWVVKGDANPVADVQHPTPDDVLGVAVFRIPGINSLDWNLGIYGLGAGLVVFLVWWFWPQRRSR